MRTTAFKKTFVAPLFICAAALFAMTGISSADANAQSTQPLYQLVDANAHMKPVIASPSKQQINELAKKELLVWLQGLRESLPQYQLELLEYTDKGDYAQVVLNITQTIKLPPYTKTEEITQQLKFKLKHGLTTGQGLLGIVTVDDFEGVYANSELEALGQRIQSMQKGVLYVQPSGNLYQKLTSEKPLEVDLGYGRLLFIPVYNSEIRVNKKEGLASFVGSVPHLLFENRNTFTDTKLMIKGMEWSQKNKPIRTHLYSFNGQTEMRIADVSLFEGSRHLLNVSDIKYKEDLKVDTQGLLQGKFSLDFNGSEVITSEYVLKEEKPSPNLFQVEIAGDIKNYQTQLLNVSGAEFLTRLLYYYLPTAEEQAALIEVLSYGPELNIDKIAVTFNQSLGSFTFSARQKPFTKESVRGKSLGDVVWKGIEVRFTMDIPQDWLNAFYTEKEDAKRKEMIENIEEETSGVIVKYKKRLRTDFSYSNGKITLNGKEVEGNFFNLLF